MELGSGSATLVCETGSFRCIGAQLEYCRGGLAWMNWQTCESAALCESEPAGRCLPALCSPEARRCTDRALERCDEHGTSWLETAQCATAAHCDTSRGECLETPCVPGQRRCNGELLEQCSADQLGWDAIEDCLTPALCENDAAGTTASCVSPSCDVGEYECAPDGSLQTCNLGQTAFVRVAECATPDLCNAPQGLCETPVCQAQQHACASNGEILVCNQQRTAFVSQVPTRSCSAGERCNVMSGACERVEAPPASAPGTRPPPSPPASPPVIPSPPITRPSAPASSGGNDDERDEAEPGDRDSTTTDPDDDGRGRQDSRNDDDRGNDGNDDNDDDRGNDGNGDRR